MQRYAMLIYAVIQSRSSAAFWQVHGFISIRRLDDVIMEDVQVLKIDIEGFETRALKGATRLFRRHNVWYLLTECNEAYLGQDGVKEYLR